MEFLTEPEARAALDELLDWHPLGRDDLPAVAEFYAECEAYDHNPERTSLVALQEFWDSPRSRPDEDTLVGLDRDGRVIATAWAGCNRAVTEKRGVYLGGAVRPDHRGRGIGRAVLAWELAHAHDWDAASREEHFGPLEMRLYAPVDQHDVRDLADRAGLQVERYFFEMNRNLTGDEQELAVEGISLVDWDPARDREAHRVVNEAFRDHWGTSPSTPEMWDEAMQSATFRPQWSVMAVDDTTGDLVGVALNAAHEQDWAAEGRTEGYTEDLGVLRSHRGRGIASALLHASMVRFNRDDLDQAGLGVDADNPSGALRLYEKLGYNRKASTCVHRWVSDSSKTTVSARQ